MFLQPSTFCYLNIWLFIIFYFYYIGQGFDRHLFGLRYIAEKTGRKIPALYEDPVFAEANHFVLSTSTLYGPAFSGGGFAPVVNDGFGIGYGFLENQMGFLVSSYSPYRDGKGFVDALKLSFDNINEVLVKSWNFNYIIITYSKYLL